MVAFPSMTAPSKRILGIAIIIGIIAGIGSLLFYNGLKWGTAFFMGYLLGYSYPQEGQSIAEISQWTDPSSLWLLLPVLCFGSLMTGILVTKFAPEAEGHGTDAAIKAFHGNSRIRWQIPVLKAVTSILTISTGGSAGREGPSAQISAGLGSLVADLLHLSPQERKIALTTGIGAGIGTIFKAPLGGAVLAAEVLYTRDFESDAIIPAFIASVIGYAIFGFFEGYYPIFTLVTHVWTIQQIPLFFILGVCCAGFGHLYIGTFYWTKDFFASFFKKHHLPLYLKPVTGAVILGLTVISLSLISPECEMVGLAGLGSSYGYTQLMLYSMVPLLVMILLPFFKILATSLTLGSGGSGGVFAPGLTIGAATGGAVGMIFHIISPEYVPIETVPVFVIVGMISLFGAVANAPIAVLIMVVEMVGSITILIPAMAAVSISNLLTGERSIFREQVPTKAYSDAHRGEFDRKILERIKIGESMTPVGKVLTCTPDDTMDHVLQQMVLTNHTGYPVIRSDILIGIITNRDVRNSLVNEGTDNRVEKIMSTRLHLVFPSGTLEEALTMMVTHNINHLPVVSEDNPDRLVGFITRTDILKVYFRSQYSAS